MSESEENRLDVNPATPFEEALPRLQRLYGPLLKQAGLPEEYLHNTFTSNEDRYGHTAVMATIRLYMQNPQIGEQAFDLMMDDFVELKKYGLLVEIFHLLKYTEDKNLGNKMKEYILTKHNQDWFFQLQNTIVATDPENALTIPDEVLHSREDIFGKSYDQKRWNEVYRQSFMTKFTATLHTYQQEKLNDEGWFKHDFMYILFFLERYKDLNFPLNSVQSEMLHTALVIAQKAGIDEKERQRLLTAHGYDKKYISQILAVESHVSSPLKNPWQKLQNALKNIGKHY